MTVLKNEGRDQTEAEFEFLIPDAVQALRKRGWGRETAEDAVSTAFIRFPQDRPCPANPLAWLITVAVRDIITAWRRDSLRRAGYAISVTIDEARLTANDTTAEEAASRAETVQRVRAALSSLAPTERRAIELRTDGNSVTAIAKVCGCHRNTVRNRLKRAEDRLRVLLVGLLTD